jgi:hypothetical protein
MRAGAHDYIVKGSLARLVPAIQRETERATRAKAALRVLIIYPSSTVRSSWARGSGSSWLSSIAPGDGKS